MLTVILLVVVWGACAVVAWRAYSRKGIAHPLPPPFPGALPIIGHTHLISGDTAKIWEILNIMTKECMQNGGVLHAKIGTEIYYLITDPDDALTVANTCLHKHFIYDYVRTWLGNGLLTSSGEEREYREPDDGRHRRGSLRQRWHDELESFKTWQYTEKSRSLLLFDILGLLHYLIDDCAKKGGVTYFSFGTELYYLIVDPQDALTAANACTQKHHGYSMLKPWMGDGLIISSGDIWKNHRKMLNPAFTLPVIHGFLDVFNSQAKKLSSSLEPHVGKGPFNHFPYIKVNSLETLCVGTFGISVIDDVEFMHKYMESVEQIINMRMARVLKYWLRSDIIYRLVGLKKKEEELVETLHAMVYTVLQKKKAALKEEALNKHIDSGTAEKKYKPFLDLLLDLSKNDALTDREIREEMDTIIAAGFETTSNQTTYTLLLLGSYPEVQEKVLQELLEVLGPDRDVDKDDVSKLIYTNAVLMESLRLYPSVPAIFRYVDKDVKLSNYTMRAGSSCVLFPLATHLDPTWGPDSDKFRPERWLDGDLRNKKEFAAFGLGKRACLGSTYAMITMKVTLAHFLRKYRVKGDVSKMKMKAKFVMRPVSGHEISIERRT